MNRDLNSIVDTLSETDSDFDPQEDFTAEDYQSALGLAIATWRAGDYPSMVVIAELIDQGFDVHALESRYMAG
jgi:hypothetical protein